MLLLGVALILGLCLFTASVARAGPRRRVGLVRPDSELLRSTTISLSSLDIDVIDTQAASPGAAWPQAREQAAEIARRLHADVVSWITESDPLAVLWTFDAESGRLGSSILASRPPFDGAAAAAVALSLKALLRSSTVAPANEERFSPSVLARPPEALRLEAAVGARVLPSETAELRGGLGASVWPRALDEHFGFGIEVSTGPGAHLQTSSIDGHFSDVSLSSSLRSHVRLGPRVALEPALAGTLHWTTFEGIVTEDDGPFHESRVNPSIDVALAADATFGALRVGLRACVGILLQSQRYLVRDETVLPAAPILGDVTLRFSAGLF